MEKKRAEVLAPAGSFESMKAAVAAGADAVYMGGSRFGARAYADNPDQEKLLEAIDYAHLRGVSLYMTVNTLMKDEEMDELYDYLRPYYEQGLDGVIVQDLGVFSFLRSRFPLLPIHGSTQMTITGVHGARMLADMGAKRVVTAREMSLEEIRRIHKEVPIEIESFVHGALCYCYSGQCLLSSFIGGRSGNRGRCAQPCRLPYDVAEGRDGNAFKPGKRENGYILSMKDLCTLDLLPDLLEAGVDSLKIEGRMKSPRYTAGVVHVYRKYVDLYLEKGRRGYQVDPQDRHMLLELFDRGGFTEGYYRQHNGPDMIARKEKPAFRQGNQELFEELDRLYIETEKKEPVKGRLQVKEGEELALTLWMKGRKEKPVQVTGPKAQSAVNQPITEERLEKQLRKTGNTPFLWDSLEIELKSRVFVPLQTLNELRRQGLERLEEAVLAPYRRKEEDLPSHRFQEKGEAYSQEGIPKLRVLLSGKEPLSQVLAVPRVEEVMIEADGIEPELWSSFAARCHEAEKRCILAMPMIFRSQGEEYFDRGLSRLLEAGFDGILVRNLEEISYLRRKGIKLPLYGDYSLYMFNRLSRTMLLEMGCKRVTLPLELNARELRALGGECGDLIGYGYLPAMVSAQCVKKTVSGCTHEPEWMAMKDRTGKELFVRNHCTYCYNVICNPVPLSLIDQREQILKLHPQGVRLWFTRETPQETGRITRAWADMLSGAEAESRPEGTFTRGHFKRGVE